MITTSPINTDRIKGQNKRLLDYLQTGNIIHCFHPKRQELEIGYLNSRIADLRKNQINILSRFITVTDCHGKPVKVKEYKLA